MRRKALKREEGVAMAEFALILPVFLLVVIGLLLFGRLFFYWIEANHLANETARWAVVDRNPYRESCPAPPPPAAPTPTTGALGCQSLQEGARSGGQTNEFEDGTRVCITYPEGSPFEVGDPVRVVVAQRFTVLGGWGIDIRGSSTMRTERFGGGAAPAFYAAGASPSGAVCS